MELLVPTVSDIVFKYTWPIEKYKKTIAKSSLIDSSPFHVNVNGIHSSWNLSIRFWKGPEGKRITNPVVLCLNMLSCAVDEIEQATIRFQFAIYNTELDHWEYCQVSRTIIDLKSSDDIVSLGYRDLSIVDRHFKKKNGEVAVMVKIQIIQCESEKHSLAQDMARLLKHPKAADTKLSCGGTSTEIPVHAGVIAARSNVLADMIVPLAQKDGEKKSTKVQIEAGTKSETRDSKENGTSDPALINRKRRYAKNTNIPKSVYAHSRMYGSLAVILYRGLFPVTIFNDSFRFVFAINYEYALELQEIPFDIVQELLRYVYTDHVANLDALANQLLSLAERFNLQGLKEACERNLIETITPENVASLLMMSEEFGCESLKRASLIYCEEHATSISKSFAWKIMERVNPELFNEACESGWTNIDEDETSD